MALGLGFGGEREAGERGERERDKRPHSRSALHQHKHPVVLGGVIKKRGAHLSAVGAPCRILVRTTGPDSAEA